MEILQTPTVNRTQDLGANGFVTIATDVHTLVINPLIAGAAPTSAYNYGGFLYPQLFIAGAATTFDPTTIGGSGSVANYFTVTGTSLSTSDTLRLLLVQTETQTIAQYTSVMVVSCADGAASANIAATYNPYSVNGGATEAYFQFMLPITPARYIFCYQKSGSSIWYQPGNAALNPAVVISSSAYGWIGDTTLTLNDGMQSLGANLGSLNPGDRVYIMSSTSTCGVGTTYQSATIASSAVGLTTTNVNSTGVYNSLTANSPSWYPVTTAGLYSLCYTKAIDSYTVQSSSLRAILSTGVWYQLQFYIGGYFQNNYRKLNGQANLIVTCPTSPQTTGTPFSVPIAIEDPSTSETLTSYVPVQVSVVATNSWSYINTGGTCSGSDRFNSTISTKTGTATFSITALSACPSGGCTFLFTSTESTNSSVCTFTLNAPNTIASLEATTDAACAIGSRCRVSISALDSTNAIVYASSAAVSLTTTTATFAGLGFECPSRRPRQPSPGWALVSTVRLRLPMSRRSQPWPSKTAPSLWTCTPRCSAQAAGSPQIVRTVFRTCNDTYRSASYSGSGTSQGATVGSANDRKGTT
ncbi:Hypothetical protein, putative [Bodo saltans]|uniref:Uncharacterized protein n=1 Tax=Bodo saltans TaxID=75058 RepID=A0A0S4IXH8_BODSA|nr:Hypothetical protein, putative [Bodo saltans]|eukprot:CUG06506.1 Hypothetical protein, putative [Bodo saltans]